MIERPIYIDIDGTLTLEPKRPWGSPIEARIETVQRLIANGKPVVIWSGGGTTYAGLFAYRYGLSGAVCIGKPEKIVDNCPTIRPVRRMPILTPEQFFGRPRREMEA